MKKFPKPITVAEAQIIFKRKVHYRDMDVDEIVYAHKNKEKGTNFRMLWAKAPYEQTHFAGVPNPWFFSDMHDLEELSKENARRKNAIQFDKYWAMN